MGASQEFGAQPRAYSVNRGRRRLCETSGNAPNDDGSWPKAPQGLSLSGTTDQCSWSPSRQRSRRIHNYGTQKGQNLDSDKTAGVYRWESRGARADDPSGSCFQLRYYGVRLISQMARTARFLFRATKHQYRECGMCRAQTNTDARSLWNG